MDGVSINDGSYVLIHGRQHPRAVNTPECTPCFSVSTSSASSSSPICEMVDDGALHSSQGSESDVLQSLRQSFSLTALANLASELVIRLLVAVLKQTVAPASDVLILNACESLAAVQMDGCLPMLMKLLQSSVITLLEKKLHAIMPYFT